MSQHFQGPFGPLFLTFCGPTPNSKGNWPEGVPYSDLCLLLVLMNRGHGKFIYIHIGIWNDSLTKSSYL